MIQQDNLPNKNGVRRHLLCHNKPRYGVVVSKVVVVVVMVVNETQSKAPAV